MYFPKHKLAIEVDQYGHKDRNINYEIKSQKAIVKELDCEFIRINLDAEKYDEYAEFGKIYNHIIESTTELTTESTEH